MLSLFEVVHLADHDVWYVSYRSNITPKCNDGKNRSGRATRKFKDETQAKQFAEEMIKDGWSAIAGTLNPHMPKKRSRRRKFSIGLQANTEIPRPPDVTATIVR